MNFILGISNMVAGLVFIGLSIPLVMRKIPMNHFYGFRLKKSFTSDENWYKINHYGGWQLIYWSVPLLVLGVLTMLFPVPENGLVVTLIGCAPLIVLVPAYLSYQYAKRL
jgi:hypothetical protein